MRRAVLLVAFVLVVSGCADGAKEATPTASSSSSSPPVTKRASVVTGNGPYEVGVDILPGVYTAAIRCVGTTAKTAEWDLMDDDADGDTGLAVAALVGEVRRIEVHRGEFFRSYECDQWQREDGSGPRTPDPSKLGGACQILLDDGLGDEVLAYLKKPEVEQTGYLYQQTLERLQAIGFAFGKGLIRPVNRLVDLVDDPVEWADVDGGRYAEATRMLADVRRACGAVDVD